FAQDKSAEVEGMPLSAQASGCIDFVLPPNKIPHALQRLAKTVATRKKRGFDPVKFLAIIGEGRRIMQAPKRHTIYLQGDASDALFYILKGTVRLTVLSAGGKEATISVLNPGDFCGEGCLTGQLLSLGSAMAM